jgi:outer membrane protein TolC
MGIALILSIGVIFFILLFQFKKVKLSLIIMSTMLLALPGAALGLKIAGYSFSITAFIGITSLCGMVVRNGIILLDYALELREKQKMSIHESAIAAGKRRMRPIFLTSAAAAVGVIPMIISRSPLWGPLGTVICFGLLISMVLTLYILPVLYSLVYSEKPKKPGLWAIPTKGTLVILAGISFLIFASPAKAQTLSLDSCKQLAIVNSKKIKEADFDLKASQEERKNAFTNYFPKVSASFTAMRSPQYLMKVNTPVMNLPVYDGNPANLQTATQFAYIPSMAIKTLDYLNVANVSVAVPIYMGGRIHNGNKLASLGEEVSRNQKILTTTEVLVHTEELYWTLISLQEKGKTLHSYQILLDTLCRDVRNFYNAGMVQRSDLLKVQLKQNELQMNKIKLNNGVILTSRALCQHIGIAFDTLMGFNAPPLQLTILPVPADAKRAVTNRTEYQLLNKAVEAGELQQKMTRGEYMPQLSVSALGVYADVAGSSQKNALALLNLSIPISDWWGGAHKIRQQKLKIERARATLDENTELLALQVEQVNNELHESWYQIQVSEKSVEQARENLKVTDDNYRSGTIGISDLLEAQAIFQNSKDSLIDAQCSYQIKLAKYLQAIGQYK